MPIYGIQKYGTDETIRNAEIETQAQRTYGHQEGEVGWAELEDWG